jgi:sugar phosphate isomerase/epimerase
MRPLILSILILLAPGFKARSQAFIPDFFCFEDAFLLSPGMSFESQVSLLKDLGFNGMEMEGLDNADEKLRILDRSGVILTMVYIQIDIDKPQPYDPRLDEFIKKISNRGVTLWLHVHSDRYGPSDMTGDEACAAVIGRLADYAGSYGVNIALYPHTGFWLEKVGDSVRLTKKIGRKNVGAVFNLCHYLKADERKALEIRLKEAIPYLAAVSINGADDGATSEMDWSRLIQPLGSGTFNVRNILLILKKSNFKGPVGLQCYDIKGNPSEFLKQSITTWQGWLRTL